MYYFSEMNSPHKNDKKFAQMFVLPDLVFFFYILLDLHYYSSIGHFCEAKIIETVAEIKDRPK